LEAEVPNFSAALLNRVRPGTVDEPLRPAPTKHALCGQLEQQEGADFPQNGRRAGIGQPAPPQGYQRRGGRSPWNLSVLARGQMRHL
jgi:hypothetical protein